MLRETLYWLYIALFLCHSYNNDNNNNNFVMNNWTVYSPTVEVLRTEVQLS